MSDNKLPTEFDPEKIVVTAIYPRHMVDFLTYKEDGINTEYTYEDLEKKITAGEIKGKINNGVACFANLRCSTSKGANRILFKVDFKQRNDKKLYLTREELKEWVIAGIVSRRR